MVLDGVLAEPAVTWLGGPRQGDEFHQSAFLRATGRPATHDDRRRRATVCGPVSDRAVV
jgi:hypothetical protein